MRIVGGAWRGRRLAAPAGQGTRPTADRVRQALFDMLMHAPWGGREMLDGVVVLDVFAGTGALGLEAMSRGAAFGCFIENDPAALKALRANVAACGAATRTRIRACDALRLGATSPAHAEPAGLVFLDPPYGRDLVPRAIQGLEEARAMTPDALIVAEVGRDETWRPERELLADRLQGAARIVVFRNRTYPST